MLPTSVASRKAAIARPGGIGAAIRAVVVGEAVVDDFGTRRTESVAQADPSQGAALACGRGWVAGQNVIDLDAVLVEASVVGGCQRQAKVCENEGQGEEHGEDARNRNEDSTLERQEAPCRRTAEGRQAVS
jgi:hypothetical protein